MPEDVQSADAFGPNAWLVDDMYEQYRQDPDSVSEGWREFFAGYRPGGANLARPTLGPPEDPEVDAAGDGADA
ncbi:MAG: 2-oxoglutarate dehydrogenase E1 subunit family protein, partial [Actinomycetes bacterium]